MMRYLIFLFLTFVCIAQTPTVWWRADIDTLNDGVNFGRLANWSDSQADIRDEKFLQSTLAFRPYISDTLGYSGIRFAGSQFMVHSADSTISINDGDWSFAGWFILNDTENYHRIFVNDYAITTNKGWGIDFQGNTNTLRFFVADGSGTYWVNKSDMVVTKNALTHIAISLDRDGSQIIRLNNVEVLNQSTSNAVDIIPTNAFSHLGARLNGQTPMLGWWFDIRIYQGIALTTAQMQNLYSSGVFDSNVVTDKKPGYGGYSGFNKY